MEDKINIKELSYFGGSPLFKEELHVGRPNIGDKKALFSRISKALNRKWLSNEGPLVRELENRISNYLKVKNVIAMCNATIALQVTISALKLTGEIILPSFTFIASAHALKYAGITPVFCDIDPMTHNIDTNKIDELITSKTSAILGVHLWGRPCSPIKLEKIAKENNLYLIYDSAHAFGSGYKNIMIGNFGDIEIFSFHATKFINSFEGGIVTTNNDSLAKKIRRFHNFGYNEIGVIEGLGTNAKMHEISAAMGLTSLENISLFIKTNYNNYLIYKNELTGIDGIKFIEYDKNEKNNFQYIVLEIQERNDGFSRDLLLKLLTKENILVRRYFYPGCHYIEPYYSELKDSSQSLDETNILSQRILQLPTGMSINKEDIIKICNCIKFISENCEKIINEIKERE